MAFSDRLFCKINFIHRFTKCYFELSYLLDCTRKSCIIDVVYNASYNELVKAKTLVRNAIVVVDSAPFRRWYESHHPLPIRRKKRAKIVSWFYNRKSIYFYSLVTYFSQRYWVLVKLPPRNFISGGREKGQKITKIEFYSLSNTA